MHDELISFIGASYFRFLGSGQKYGLSARGLAIGVGAKETEEFPLFREFWVEQPEANSDRAVVHALLDSESVTGAYRFDIYAARDFRHRGHGHALRPKRLERFGIAPLTSMFFTGENDRRFVDDFRPELHDSDGLLMHTGAGEWIWRPLRNPTRTEAAAFLDNNIKGFGLMQRGPHLRALSGSRPELRTAAELLGRAPGGLGSGQGRTVRDPDNRRDQRQHRRAMGAGSAPRTGAEPHLALPRHLHHG